MQQWSPLLRNLLLKSVDVNILSFFKNEKANTSAYAEKAGTSRMNTVYFFGKGLKKFGDS